MYDFICLLNMYCISVGGWLMFVTLLCSELTKVTVYPVYWSLPFELIVDPKYDSLFGLKLVMCACTLFRKVQKEGG